MGYTYMRSGYRMLIEMEEPAPQPVWPDGITLRTYNAEDAEAIYHAFVDSFRDHFGFVEEPFEQGFKRFQHFQLSGHDFDPTLIFLAIDESSGQMAGFNICQPHVHDDPQVGWVGILGVRRPWRKRGLGLALLRHSFNEFYRRGKRKVGLGVDAQNLTGALRLYENAGMHVYEAFDQYEKELRAGTEISVQSLQE
jgi:mycothiol synthase